MGEFAIGQSALRREDPRLLQGRGRFFDDLKLADQLHAAIVRSPHAHADITGIDTRTALQMPGVHAVLTGADYRADGLGTLPSMAPYKRRGGSPMFLPLRPAIALNRVKFRKNGINGIGLSDLMAAAGLTHGGFYRHFESKDQLQDQAGERGFGGAGQVR